MPEREFPRRPNLEQYKKQAKDLVKDRANAAPEAFARIRHYHPRLRGLPDLDIQSAPFKLSDAQLIIAREHAFESWPKFAAASPDVASGDAKSTANLPDVSQSTESSLRQTLPYRRTPRDLCCSHTRAAAAAITREIITVADLFHRGVLGTVLTDLLTEEEELADIETEELRFDIRLLGRRIAAITDWIGEQPRLKDLGLGYFASGTGSAAALFAAAARPSLVHAVVSSGGRPDLAGPWIWKVQAPTLLIVGGKDTAARGLQSLRDCLAFQPKPCASSRSSTAPVNASRKKTRSKKARSSRAIGFANTWAEGGCYEQSLA